MPQTAATEALAKRLEGDPDPTTVPRGYTFVFGEPTAMGDDDVRQKMRSAPVLLFDRAVTSGEPLRESIYFYVFDSPADAAAYDATWNDVVELFENHFGGRKLDKRSWRLERRLEVKSPTGPLRPLRCRAMDGFISCLVHNPGSPVVINLMLQEEPMNRAGNDAAREVALAGRMNREADSSLLKTAQAHLAAALRPTR